MFIHIIATPPLLFHRIDKASSILRLVYGTKSLPGLCKEGRKEGKERMNRRQLTGMIWRRGGCGGERLGNQCEMRLPFRRFQVNIISSVMILVDGDVGVIFRTVPA